MLVASGLPWPTEVGFAPPHADLPALSLRAMDVASTAPRGWGWITLPTVGSCGAPCVTLGGGTALGTGAALAGVAAVDELVDDGLDHPGPVIDERWVSVVSFAVTSRE